MTHFYSELLSLVVEDPPSEVDPQWVRDFSRLVRATPVVELSNELGRIGKNFDSFLAGSRVLMIPHESETDSGYPRSELEASLAALIEGQPCWGPEQADVVKYVRQVCYFLYKLALPYSLEKEEGVVSNFVWTDEELGDMPLGFDIPLGKSFIRRVFQDFDPRSIRPRNGPGSVSTGERLDDKWRFSRIYEGIDQYYPFHDYFSMRRGVDDLEDLYALGSPLRWLQRGIAKVVLVNKDARGPRLISEEALEYQYIQQGLGRKIVAWVENHRLTSGMVNFTNQEVNRKLALSASVSGDWVTLDLKDASDRVSLELVRYLWQDLPEMLSALEACRSDSTMLPSGKVISLNKYAPMGSALCFPVLALTISAVLVDALRHDISKPVPFYVYGDDIIVRTMDAERAVQALESVGLRVNISKSCLKGNFRESCGMDAFYGVQVTPIRVKVLWASENVADSYESYCALANALCKAGYVHASDWLWKKLEDAFGFIPWGDSESGFPCREVDDPQMAELLNVKVRGLRRRFNADYQRVEFRVRILVPQKYESRLDSWDRLLQNLLLGGSGDFDPTFLDVRQSSKITWAWSAV